MVGLSKNIGFSCFFLQRIERDRERDLWRDERGHGVRPRKKINEEGGMSFPFPWGTSALSADSGVVPDAKARERERERGEVSRSISVRYGLFRSQLSRVLVEAERKLLRRHHTR